MHADPATTAAFQAVLPNSEIAATLHLAEGTVRNYLSVAITKLGARNRFEAAHMAQERGWL